MTNYDGLHVDITERIIGAFYEVYKHLGHGFLEKVYEKALAQELVAVGLPVQTQMPLSIRYKGILVGEYVADLVVDSKVIAEIKAARNLTPEHHAQLLNYLKATGIQVGLLLNFGPNPQIKRLVF